MSKAPAIYTRVSTERQEEKGASLDTQEAACRNKLAELGHDPETAILFREVHTGVDFFERKQLSALRAGIRAGEFDLVICYDLDRLSRDATHIGTIFTEASFYGVDIQFVVGTYDNTLEGELIRIIKGVAGKVEYERLRDRAKRGHQGRVAKGLPTIGVRVPYGLRWADEDKTRFEEDLETSPVLRRIFNEVAAGSSARQVAKRLTADGISSPAGLPVWGNATICKMLRNEIYWTGNRESLQWELEHETVPGIGRKVRHRKRKEGTVTVKDIAPILVSPEIAAAAQAQIPKNKTYSVRNTRDPEKYLLRGGFAVCGYCGRALGINKDRYGYVYVCTQFDRYGCPSFGIRTHKLDDMAWDKVREIVSNPEIIEKELANRSQVDPVEADLEMVDRRLVDLRKKQKRLVSRLALVDDDVAELVQTELTLYTDQIRQLEEERGQLLATQGLWLDANANLDSLLEWSHRIANELEKFSYEERRNALRALNLQARVKAQKDGDRVEIRVTLQNSLSPLGWRS